MNRGRQYKAAMIAVIILFVSGLIYCGMLVVNDNGKKQQPERPSATNSPDFSRSFTGIVKDIDEENQTISLGLTENATQMTLRYNGGTDVRNQFDKIISMKGITLGEIVRFTYDTKVNKLISLNIDKNAWSYENVKKMRLDNEKGVIQLGSSRYGFHESIVFVGEGELISLSDLSAKDQFTVKGIGETVYSIIVTKGHGIIRFTNIEDFVGGTVYIGASTYKKIKGEPFRVIVREGSCKIVLQKDRVIGTKEVTVKRGEELTVDRSELSISKAKEGKIKFQINPYGADLYIDGKQIDYSAPVTLSYGNHTIAVTLSGYKSFSGMLTVGQADQDIEVNLVPDTSEEESSSKDDNVSSEDKTDSDDILLDWDSDKKDDKTDSGNKENNLSITDKENIAAESPKPAEPSSKASGSGMDTLHKITIQSPAEVEVYVDDAYKGIAPVSFTKVLGVHVITLKKNGYATKTYTVHVEDNNENVFYTFGNLVKK
ncbi:PEGA domain-containing protein [[Clostridium] polysaccharolyticum]|uniref:PEGA domain-containing protein n=1 Tax=[Clostridium] polysaccharolyticum TaxID=29364 RepID=A0A1I0FYG3_9FIRM|nr:PEGA domain-containing protein [[Clostridium] polysaccharolyticum]SET63466.1 PEGA domain-containing protein [[Clostridium] polysaccharolyticum]